MTKFFIIGTELFTNLEDKMLMDSLGDCDWWHWLPEMWLIRDDDHALNVTIIRDNIQKITQKKEAIVIEVTPQDWASLSKKDHRGQDMTEWLNEFWDSE